MKNRWQTLPFEEAVQSRGSGNSGLAQKEWEKDGRFPVIGQGAEDVEGWTNREDLLLTPSPSLVLYGGHTRRAKHVSQPFVPGPNVKILQPISGLDSKFLFHFLTYLPIESKGYADHFPLVRKVDVPIPPLSEQRRIVGVLDEAFAGIATAQANAETNLKNARALFASHLQDVFSKKGKGWVERTLGETCEMYQPQTISMKDLVEDGKYPVFGANGIIGRYDKFNHEEPQLLITCRGATCGAVNVSEPKSWITGNAMVVRPKDGALNLRFLEFAFRGGIDISKAITGAAQPQITRTNLSPLLIRYPKSLDEQKRIANTLGDLSAETARLAGVYEQKLGALAELKKSLLHHAFAGEL
jgi:hypothetical protein